MAFRILAMPPSESAPCHGQSARDSSCGADSIKLDASNLETRDLEAHLARLTRQIAANQERFDNEIEAWTRSQSDLMEELLCVARGGAAARQEDEATRDWQTSPDGQTSPRATSGAPRARGRSAERQVSEEGVLAGASVASTRSFPDGPAKVLGIDTKRKPSQAKDKHHHWGGRQRAHTLAGLGGLRTQLGRLLSHPWFETFCWIVILTNSLWTACQADDAVMVMLERQHAPRPFMSVVEAIFTLFYTFEVMLRIGVLRLNFVAGADQAWNVFDALLVVTGWYDAIGIVFDGSSPGNLSWLRVLRLMEVLKLLRMVRLMRAFKELSLILNSIMSSMKSMI